MGKQKRLSGQEKEQIDNLRSEGLSNREIGKQIGRSSNVVDHYIKKGESYGKNYKGRTAMALTPKDKCKIIRIASDSAIPTSKIKELANVTASKSTVRRAILEARHLNATRNKSSAKNNDTGTNYNKTWAELRDTCRTVEKRKKGVPSEQEAIIQKMRKFEKQMPFLEPHMAESKNNYITSDDEPKMNGKSYDDLAEEASTTDAPVTSPSSEKAPDTSLSRKSQSPEIACSVQMQHLLQNQQETEKKSDNELDTFFLCMAKTVKKFSSLNQFKAKTKIFSIVSDLEYDELSEKSAISIHPLLTEQSPRCLSLDSTMITSPECQQEEFLYLKAENCNEEDLCT